MSDLETRVSELEPYPDLLQSTEQKLRDASDLLRQYEQRHLENVRHITELTSKVGMSAVYENEICLVTGHTTFLLTNLFSCLFFSFPRVYIRVAYVRSF